MVMHFNILKDFVLLKCKQQSVSFDMCLPIFGICIINKLKQNHLQVAYTPI